MILSINNKTGLFKKFNSNVLILAEQHRRAPDIADRVQLQYQVSDWREPIALRLILCALLLFCGVVVPTPPTPTHRSLYLGPGEKGCAASFKRRRPELPSYIQGHESSIFCAGYDTTNMVRLPRLYRFRSSFSGRFSHQRQSRGLPSKWSGVVTYWFHNLHTSFSPHTHLNRRTEVFWRPWTLRSRSEIGAAKWRLCWGQQEGRLTG